MRKIFRSLLVLVFGVFLISSINVKATSPLVEAIDGASIRTQGVQGLRFYARLDESMKVNEHGFYLVYGKTTIAELEAAITAADGGTITLNDKTVFKVPVTGVTAENEFSVVLIGIPEAGYFDNVSVIPYVVVNEENVYSATTVSRSVAEVALKMANAGEDIRVIQGVNAITATDKKKVAINADGNLAVSGGVYELNPYNLREEFVKDWNAKFGTPWTSLDPEAFNTSAAEGIAGNMSDNKDLSPGNLYKFFNDAAFKPKWDWVLNFIRQFDPSVIHHIREIDAVLGDGTNADYVLWKSVHLNYSIANFFNKAHYTGGWTAASFTNASRYATLGNYNDKVYVDASKYDFHNVGDTIVLPAAIPQAGYNFSHYVVGGANYNAGADYVITTDDVVVEPVYTPIEYTVTFYDGETVLTDLNTTYNIVNGLPSLPAYSKEGYTFLGWYVDETFSGDPVTSIPAGQTGTKTYYARMSSSPMVYYHLGDYGYHTTTDTKDDLFTSFVTDYKAIFARGATVDELKADFFGKSYLPAGYTFTDIFTYDNGKHAWVREHILALATAASHPGLSGLNSGNQGHWRLQIHAFFKGIQLTNTVGTSLDFSNENNCHNFWQYLDYGVYEVEFTPNGALFTGVKTESLLYEFAGWYANPERTGDPVTVLPESTTSNIHLYAKWVLK